MPVRRGRTPLEVDAEKKMRELERTAKMETQLRSYGRETPGGYMMTKGDLVRYFRDYDKRKGRIK